MTDGVQPSSRASDWVAGVTDAFAGALARGVARGQVADVAVTDGAAILGVAQLRLLGHDDEPPAEDGLVWHAVPVGTRRRLAAGRAGHLLWTPRHAAALDAMAAMLLAALYVELAGTDERRLRSAQASAQAAMLRKLERRQQVLTEMVQVQRSLARRAPLQEKLDLVTAAVARVLDVELVGIRLVDSATPDELVVVSGAGLDGDLPLRSPVSDSGVGGLAFRRNETVTVEDYDGHTDAMATYRASGVQAAAATPVQQFGRAVGSIVAATRAPARRFTEDDLETLRAFADQASIALTEQHLFSEMQQGLIDPLTGLANRARLHDQLVSALELATGSGAGPAVLFVDLDGFKMVNDAFGHSVGDELLVKVAERLRDVVVAPDLAARFGGDEFTVLLPVVRDIAEAVRAADVVLDSLQSRFLVSGHDIAVSASIGIAWDRRRPSTAPGSASDAAVDMLRCADTAMYRAKSAGRNQFAVFEERMHDELVRRMDRERQLRLGVERDELAAYFQPVVDLETGACTGAEALVRWNRDGQLVPPAHFMHLAEETGLIVPVGRRVLEQACAVLAAWGRAGHHGLSMSVNLSPRELESPTLVEEVRAQIATLGLTPGSLVIELTESSLMRDVDAVAQILHELRALGVRVAIDDFGTGYSSLARLRWLPIDILKIDRSFVELVDADAGSQAMLRAVLTLAAALDLQVVVEGIEREEQRSVLTGLGCRWGQGYLFSAAVPAERLGAFLRGDAVPRQQAWPRPVRAAAR